MWSTYFYIFMLFGNLFHNIQYQRKTILGVGSFKLVILEFSFPNFSDKVSGSKKFRVEHRNIEEGCVKILATSFLYF